MLFVQFTEQVMDGCCVGNKPCIKKIVFSCNINLLFLQAGIDELVNLWIVHGYYFFLHAKKQDCKAAKKKLSCLAF